MIMEGIFERLPELKVVLIECGFRLAAGAGLAARQAVEAAQGRGAASEDGAVGIHQEAFLVTTQPMEETENPEHLMEVMNWIGMDRIMFSSDYPHWDFDDPFVSLPPTLTDEQRRKSTPATRGAVSAGLMARSLSCNSGAPRSASPESRYKFEPCVLFLDSGLARSARPGRTAEAEHGEKSTSSRPPAKSRRAAASSSPPTAAPSSCSISAVSSSRCRTAVRIGAAACARAISPASCCPTSRAITTTHSPRRDHPLPLAFLGVRHPHRQSWCDPDKVKARRFGVSVEKGAKLIEGPYVAETFRVSVENDYVGVET